MGHVELPTVETARLADEDIKAEGPINTEAARRLAEGLNDA